VEKTDHLPDTSPVFRELSSNVRRQILLKLGQKKFRKAELVKQISRTSAETYRNIDRLIKAGLVTEDSEKWLSITAFGEALVWQVPSFAFLREHRRYFAEHIFGDLPLKFIRNIGALYDCELIHGVIPVIETWKMIYHDARQYICSILTQISSEMVVDIARAIRRGAKFSYLLAENAIVTKDRSEIMRKLGWHGLYHLSDGIAKGSIQRKMAKKVNIVTVLNERQASVLFPSLNGDVDLNTMFYSDDPIFHEWCLDYFRYKWDRSQKFDESRIKKI
jgi:predicted transcriptional regulator